MACYDLGLQRKQEIEDNLLTLMQDTPYERIPVKDLTDNLQIARKTFYHYFHNKQACLESLMDRMIQECSLIMLALPAEASLPDTIREILLFWIRSKTFLEAVMRNDLGTLFARRILLHLDKEDSDLPAVIRSNHLSCDRDVLYYHVSGYVCLILKWCREGFSRPLEEMVQVNLQLIQETLSYRNGR